MVKIHFGQPSRAARAPTRKRKNNVPEDFVSLAPFGKKMHIGLRKDGMPPSVPETWSDQIIKEKGEDQFWEQVHNKEVNTYPAPPPGYSWQTIGFEARSTCRVFIPADSILKFKFECREFLLSVTKFGSNSQFVQGWEAWVNKVIEKPACAKVLSLAGVFDAVRVTSKLQIHREKRMDVWRAILAR